MKHIELLWTHLRSVIKDYYICILDQPDTIPEGYTGIIALYLSNTPEQNGRYILKQQNISIVIRTQKASNAFDIMNRLTDILENNVIINGDTEMLNIHAISSWTNQGRDPQENSLYNAIYRFTL